MQQRKSVGFIGGKGRRLILVGGQRPFILSQLRENSLADTGLP